MAKYRIHIAVRFLDTLWWYVRRGEIALPSVTNARELWLCGKFFQNLGLEAKFNGLGPMALASKVQALASDLWPWPRTYGLEGPGLGLGLMALASDLWSWPRRSRPWPRTYGLGLGPMVLVSKVQAFNWPRTYGLIAVTIFGITLKLN